MTAHSEPIAVYEFDPDDVDAALKFLKRTRVELRILSKVRVWKDRVQILDVNQDYFEIRGLGYVDKSVIAVLDNINTAFKRESIHDPTDAEYKEFQTGRRYPWAADRVM